MIRSEKKQFEMTQLSAKQRAAKLELVDNLTERYVTCFVRLCIKSRVLLRHVFCYVTCFVTSRVL